MESLSAPALGVADALCLCPERAICHFFASVSLIPFAIWPLSRRVFTEAISPLEVVALAEWRLPVRWVPSKPMWLALAPPILPYTGPGQSPRRCRAPLGALVGVSYFYCSMFC